MIIFVSCIGAVALFYIQFRLYKMEEHQGLKHFLNSSQLCNVIKEFLVILLGATIALNVTAFVEENATKEQVIKQLEIAANDIEREYFTNALLINLCGEPDANVKEIISNKFKNTVFFEMMLSNDTVLTTISPDLFSSMANDMYNLNYFYEEMKKSAASDDYRILMLKTINSHCENILWAIKIEIEHLRGNYSEQEVRVMRQNYYNSKYVLVGSNE